MVLDGFCAPKISEKGHFEELCAELHLCTVEFEMIAKLFEKGPVL